MSKDKYHTSLLGGDLRPIEVINTDMYRTGIEVVMILRKYMWLDKAMNFP